MTPCSLDSFEVGHSTLDCFRKIEFRLLFIDRHDVSSGPDLRELPVFDWHGILIKCNDRNVALV